MDAGELPVGWVSTSVGEVCSNLQYGYTASSSSEPNGPRFLRITDIQDGLVAWPSVPFCQIDSQLLDKYLLCSGDLVFARTGGTVGKSFLIGHLPEPAVFASYLIRLSPSKEVDPKYLYYFFQSTEYWEQIGLKKGGLQGNVNAKTLSSVEFYLSPLAEQHRIVAKIEELFSELDQGVASLKTTREQLKVYRQSLLKNAFEGKLTAAWRAAHRDQLETSATLQQRIARERQARYQQQLADWQTAGQAGPKPKPPKSLPPLTAKELAELPELPAGWGWFKLADVSDVSGGLTKNQKRELLTATRPYLRVANVYANRLELNEIHNIGVTESELGRVALEKGDLLIVEGNGSIDQIGRVALWGGQIADCVHQNHIIKARPLKLATSKFLLYFLMSEIGRKFIVRAASSTSGLHTLSISKVEGLFVPLCSGNEQAEVIAELESKLSEADQLDQTLATALQQADALRQSILKKAFHGQLVKQAKNEEPATALLERIRAERTASPAKGRQAKMVSKPLPNC